MSKKSVVKLSVKDGQSKEDALAEFWLTPSTMGASVIDAYKKNVQGDELSFEMALDVLKKIPNL